MWCGVVESGRATVECGVVESGRATVECGVVWLSQVGPL